MSCAEVQWYKVCQFNHIASGCAAKAFICYKQLQACQSTYVLNVPMELVRHQDSRLVEDLQAQQLYSLYSRSIYITISMLFAGQQTIQAPWQLAVHGSQYKSLAQSWCWQPTLTNCAVCGSAIESWQSLEPKAQSTVGFVVECHLATVTSETFVPQSVVLNGSSCFVSQ